MESLETYILAAENTEGKKQHLRRRATEELTKEQVKAIKKGRKLLRKEMRAKGLKEKSDFELMAANLGLYFDKPRWLLWWKWFTHGKGLAMLLGALIALLAALFLYASVTQLQGHFTINMSNGLFDQGFILSETPDFANATTHLFCTPAENVPCVSISNLPESLDAIDGQHNAAYFAYTFYCRNEGSDTVGYEWQVNLNSESGDLSQATWVMIFEDGEMTFYARPNRETGKSEALPAFDDNSRGYITRPLEKFCADPDAQYETIKQMVGYEYARVIPKDFVTDYVVSHGVQEEVEPMEVHKYTVVIWLEGDDPDCTDELIGGHVGMDFYFQLIEEEDGSNVGEGSINAHWNNFWSNLKFWKD